LVKTDGSGNLLWNKTFGGKGEDAAWSVHQTTDGGYILGGWTASFGAGSFDFYLIKTDENGNLLWSKTFGGTGDDHGFSAIQTKDGGYAIIGYTSSFGMGEMDTYIVKTDENGNLQWNKTYGGSNRDFSEHVWQTSDGGYITSGFTYSFGEGGDLYVVKTDGSGNLSWSKTIGGASYDRLMTSQITNDGGFVVAGATGSFGAGAYDMYLIKTDANGNAGGCNTNNAATIVTTPNPTVTSPVSLVTSPVLTVTSPALTVTSPNPIVTSICSQCK
jgi:hypothetical protein